MKLFRNPHSFISLLVVELKYGALVCILYLRSFLELLLGHFLLRKLSKSDIELSFFQRKEHLIRSLLRSIPWWLKGHLRLGFLAIDYELSESGLNQIEFSKLAVITASAEAILKLNQGCDHCWGRRIITPNSNQIRVIAAYFMAMKEFLSGNFAQALNFFENLLKEPDLSFVLPKLKVYLWEYAGTSAMALNRNEEAFIYLSQISKLKKRAAAAYFKTKAAVIN